MRSAADWKLQKKKNSEIEVIIVGIIHIETQKEKNLRTVPQ